MSVPATFVTNDSRMSHGKLHDDDLRVLAEAGRGEGRVVKPEELATLAEAAASTWRAAQTDAARVLTPGGGMAQIIRRLRCEEGYTWRAVAAAVSRVDHPSGLKSWVLAQLLGQALCEAAAAELGEDPNAAPWN